jgi:hypothetical protein
MTELLIAFGFIGGAIVVWLGSVIYMLWKYEEEDK